MPPLTPDQSAIADSIARLAPILVSAASNGHLRPSIGLPSSKRAAVVFESFVAPTNDKGAMDAIQLIADEAAKVGFVHHKVVFFVHTPIGTKINVILAMGDEA